jgi:hypothetical protein
MVALGLGSADAAAEPLVGSAPGSPGAPGVPAANDRAGDFVRTDSAERLVAALESAQSELEHAAAARAEALEAAEARSGWRAIETALRGVYEKAQSDSRIVTGAAIAGGALLGALAMSLGRRAGSAAPRQPRAPRAPRVPAPARGRASFFPWSAPHANPAPAPAPAPRPEFARALEEESVPARPPARPAGREAESENVWAKILRLSASGMPGDEIARSLGASADDVNLVLGLQRRRAEIAGALARSAGSGMKAAAR